MQAFLRVFKIDGELVDIMCITLSGSYSNMKKADFESQNRYEWKTMQKLALVGVAPLIKKFNSLIFDYVMNDNTLSYNKKFAKLLSKNSGINNKTVKILRECLSDVILDGEKFLYTSSGFKKIAILIESEHYNIKREVQSFIKKKMIIQGLLSNSGSDSSESEISESEYSEGESLGSESSRSESSRSESTDGEISDSEYSESDYSEGDYSKEKSLGTESSQSKSYGKESSDTIVLDEEELGDSIQKKHKHISNVFRMLDSSPNDQEQTDMSQNIAKTPEDSSSNVQEQPDMAENIAKTPEDSDSNVQEQPDIHNNDTTEPEIESEGLPDYHISKKQKI
jgi:hypothetical protein